MLLRILIKMKIKNKVSLLFVVLFVTCLFVQSCSKDDTAPFNPALQLEIDIRLIDEYVASNSLNVEIEPNSNVRYFIEEEGNGRKPGLGDTVYVNYELSLLDGTFIDTSLEQSARDNGIFSESRNYQPFGFIVGRGTVIPGFEVAALLLEEQGTGTFLIPSIYGYSIRGSANIPANANLNFRISLVTLDK
ncbi:MAG: FKBP-type peptidyl-prolyl cis-trans isomerase [Roseivirga sp.]